MPKVASDIVDASLVVRSRHHQSRRRTRSTLFLVYQFTPSYIPSVKLATRVLGHGQVVTFDRPRLWDLLATSYSLNFDMADAPAARTHILRPHHVLMAAVLRLTHTPEWTFTDLFLLEMYKLVMKEISEIYQPLPYRDFYRKIQEFDKGGRKVYPRDIEIMASCLDGFINQMTHPDFLHTLFTQLDGLIWERDLHSNAVFERRSYFGMFIRRTRLSMQKLSFSGMAKFIDDFQGWASSSNGSGYAIESNWDIPGMLSYPTPDDDAPHATPEAFAEYENAEHVGDITTAVESLRRFFSQRFSEEADSGFNQYTLLRLASTYYLNGQMKAAKDTIEEAMKVCRNAGDRYTLISCSALQRRINAFYPDHEPTVLRKGFKQLDVLWDLRRSLESGEPVSKCWKFLWYASAGAKDLSDGGKGRDRSSMASASAFMWKLSGIESLGNLWENMSLLHMDENAEDVRLTNLIWRSTTLVRQGRYDEAWVTMMDPSTWRPLSLQQAQQWQWELWCNMLTFSIRTERKGLADYLRKTMPRYPTQQNYQGKLVNVEKGDLGAGECLRLGNNYISSRQYLLALSPVLTAATLTEYACNWQMHRTALIMIADLGIGLGMAPSGQRLIEEQLPQILRGDDLEQRAYGCFTLARCMIANADGDVSKLQEAIPWLQRAWKDYEAIELIKSTQQVLYVLAVVYENLRDEGKRDAASERLLELEAIVTERSTKAVEPKYMAMMELSVEVLAYVAVGGRSVTGDDDSNENSNASTIPEYDLA
ncbi:hypothetical protein CALCODRAFT_175597 [Calocera cornea HHB12733]|uniref:Anaphase-promoting complex subunit 5 n=1 Tax=Calocera cornea HHB12733 TaxID=1353952 RepID=A0A165HUC8_9BASI|nr:hypothetical protein CALCODRAFT_175597 [Calocera cornea HHB12733]